MEKTSPRKYIQTRARSLPIHKCYANKDWENAGLATVIVVRQHVNKKFTGAMYLVDLKCLGVKDTSWFFNITEEEFLSSIPAFEEGFAAIEYKLAHNIIYAGHDFAMDFDIGPHKDFSVTKFILEEDDDGIPIIDIPVGDKDGIPHLLTYGPNEHLDALARLRKNAGEGNFRYTYSIGEFSEDEEFDDDDDLDDDAKYLSLSEIEPGTIDPHVVKHVAFEDLMNIELMKERDALEQLICMAEAFIRIVDPEHPLSSDEEVLMEAERSYYYRQDVDYTESEVGTYQDCINMIRSNPVEEDESRRDVLFHFERSMNQAKDNPVSAALLNIFSLVAETEKERTAALITEKMRKLTQHDIIQLSLALRSIVTNDQLESYEAIVQQRGYNNIFSGKTENFHEDCLTLYYMIQVIRYSRSNKIALTIDYYRLLSGQHENLFFTFGYALFYPVFIDALRRYLPEPSAIRES
jgi:hypothetical protein